jgi:non-heme chloroperoxidase
VRASITTRDGAAIAFADEGAGTTLVLLPGICCSRRWWSLQVAALSGAHRLVTIDFRGVGESRPVSHGHRVARYSADVAELIEALDLRGVVLVGWSLGFSVSLGLLELAGEERLAGLVLVEGSPRLLNGPGWRLGIADLEQAVRMRASLRDEWAPTITALLGDMSGGPDARALLTEALRADPGSIAQLFWDHVNQDWRDVLGTISLPTLVIAGTASRIGDSVAAARYTAGAITGARLELFAGAGHAVFREQPERFSSMLAEFALAATSARQRSPG